MGVLVLLQDLFGRYGSFEYSFELRC